MTKFYDNKFIFISLFFSQNPGGGSIRFYQPFWFIKIVLTCFAKRNWREGPFLYPLTSKTTTFGPKTLIDW